MDLLAICISSITWRRVFYQPIYFTKIVVMKPESILQSDLLDILFYNRNKDYGAYSLRKQYNSRLAKAIAFTFGLVIMLSLSWYIQIHYFKSHHSSAMGQPVKDVYLNKVEEMKKSAQPEAKKAVAKKVAQIANTTIKIVSDDKVDKPIAAIVDMDNKEISTITADGIPDDGSAVARAAEEDKNGAVIEPKNEETVAETRPLVNAEVMPEFPGGSEAFKKFMLRNLREPDDLQEGEKVVVVVKFIVEADGTIVHAEILKSGGKYDDEVLKVVKKMPHWKPGMQNGKLVPVYFSLPVTFTGAAE